MGESGAGAITCMGDLRVCAGAPGVKYDNSVRKAAIVAHNLNLAVPLKGPQILPDGTANTYVYRV